MMRRLAHTIHEMIVTLTSSGSDQRTSQTKPSSGTSDGRAIDRICKLVMIPSKTRYFHRLSIHITRYTSFARGFRNHTAESVWPES